MSTRNTGRSISLGDARQRAIADMEAAEQRRRDAVEAEAQFQEYLEEETEPVLPDIESPLSVEQLLKAHEILFKPVEQEEYDLPEGEETQEEGDVSGL